MNKFNTAMQYMFLAMFTLLAIITYKSMASRSRIVNKVAELSAAASIQCEVKTNFLNFTYLAHD